MAKRIVVYLTQYDGWWAATQEQWQALLAEAKQGQGYDLDTHCTRLANRPRTVKVNRYAESKYNRYQGDIPIVHPLDAEAHDWASYERQVADWWKKHS